MKEEKTLELIWSRRSIRDFERREIDKETVDTLKAMTLRAPSAGNMEMYTIIEVEDKEKKRALSEICDGQKMIENAPLIWIFLSDMEKWERYFILSKSPEKFSIPLPQLGLGDMLLSFEDAVIAAQNSVIAAEALGLGSCYIGDIMENCEIHRELFGLPPYVFPAVMAVFGYPTKQQEERVKPRRVDLEHLVHENAYRRMDETELKGMFAEKGGNQTYDEWITAFCKRKYNSDFSREMSRSVAEYMKNFVKEE